MTGILMLESLTRGNTLKQGDKTPLTYRLLDADGDNLNIAGKQATVRLVYPNYLTIGYEKSGLIVSKDDTVTFTIDNIIPSRKYNVEIIVDNKFVFPSRSAESKFTIDKSSLGTESNIIEIVGIDAVASKVIERIGDNIGEVVNAEEVAGAIESGNLLDGKVIPKDDSVTNKKLATGSTTLSKINIDGYLPMTLEHEREGGYTRRYSVVYLKVGDIIKLNGDFQVSISKIKEPTDTYVDGSEGRRVWSHDDWTVPEESWYYIRVRFESNASILGDDLDNLINRGVVILTSDTAVTKKELNEALDNLPAEAAPQKLSQSGDVITLSGNGGTINLSHKQDKLTDGDITTPLIADESVKLSKLHTHGYLPMTYTFKRGDFISPGNPLNRAFSEPTFASAGTRIEASDLVQISVQQILPDGTTRYIHNGWVNSVTVPEDMEITIRAKFPDDSAIPASDLPLIENEVYRTDGETAMRTRDFEVLEQVVTSNVQKANEEIEEVKTNDINYTLLSFDRAKKESNKNLLPMTNGKLPPLNQLHGTNIDVGEGMILSCIIDPTIPTGDHSDTHIYSIDPDGYVFFHLSIKPEANLKRGDKIHVYFDSPTGFNLKATGSHAASIAYRNMDWSRVGFHKFEHFVSTWYGIELELPDLFFDVMDEKGFNILEIRLDNRAGTEPIEVENLYFSFGKPYINQLFLDSLGEKIDTNLTNTIGRPHENMVANSFGELSPDEAVQEASVSGYSAALNIANVESGNGEIVVNPGGWYFYQFAPWESLDFLEEITFYLKLDDPDKFGEYSLSVRNMYDGGRSDIYYNFTRIPKTDWFSCTVPVEEGQTRTQLRIDTRTKSEPAILTGIMATPYKQIDMLNLVLNSEKSAGTSSGSGKVVKYVSLNGSDNNSGDSFSQACATFQKAYDEGADTIIAQRGVYHDQALLATGDVTREFTIIPYRNNTYVDISTQTQKIEIKGSVILEELTLNSQGIYEQEYSKGGVSWQNVFIDKTSPPISTSSRPAPNAKLWEGNDGYIDEMLTPVLSVAECEETTGSFYWDGAKVFVNPKSDDISNVEFNATTQVRGLSINGFGKVSLVDVFSDFGNGSPMDLSNNRMIEVHGCGASHSGTTDGFRLNNVSGNFYQCFAYKNRNDGFNSHTDGNLVFFNCRGYNNFDDGISFHEIAKGAIYGGEWFGNGKGGIIHVNASPFDVYGATCYDNRYGIYFVGGLPEGEHVNIIVRDCETYGNLDGVLIGQSYRAKVANVNSHHNSQVNFSISNNSQVVITDSEGNDGIIGVRYKGSGSGSLEVVNTRLSDNSTGIANVGNKTLKLSRNNIVHNSTGIESTGETIVDRRNNLYGNDVDYSGSGISENEKGKNVSLPTI